MRERKRFNLSLSLDNPLHREAWELINGFPERERTNAVCWGICKAYNRKNDREEIREILREELQNVRMLPSDSENSAASAQNKCEEERDVLMDSDIADFLSGLSDGKIEGF